MLNDLSVFNSKKLCDRNPWIALVSLEMYVQSYNVSISCSSMNDDFQARMPLEHPFNELNKTLRPICGHLRIMLGVREPDVFASRFGRLFLVYGKFVERRYQLFVFFFYRSRCHSRLPVAFEAASVRCCVSKTRCGDRRSAKS